MSEIFTSVVREAIDRARQEGSEWLDLSSYELGVVLDEIPEEVFELEGIKELVLSNHRIREVPERIRQIGSLEVLDLSRNPIEALPDVPGLVLDWATYFRCRRGLSRENVSGLCLELDSAGLLVPEQSRTLQLSQELSLLPRLRGLFVSTGARFVRPSANVRELLGNLGSFSHLQYLSIAGVFLDEVPSGLRALKQLRELSLSGTGLQAVPAWLGELTQLRTLDLENNSLSDLPASLASLTELERLYLSRNPFTTLPEVVFELGSLQTLVMQAGRQGAEASIRNIPVSILALPRLSQLDLEGHPVEVPPPEVVKEGAEAVRNYWRQQQEAGVDYLAEAKLIIVGEAGAGKSTLARKIKSPGYRLKPEEPSTEGIDVMRWSFPTAVNVRWQGGHEQLRNTVFNASIWDFGGQEIYHATHQFFLTRRSLYALVADDRKEDTDFNYWLQVVELLSEHSPLLIVQNEKQDRQRDIDLATLRANFPNLRDAFRVNLATNRGLSTLVTAIRHELQRLPHIGTPLPRTWSKVRAALESDPRHYIGIDEYLGVCEENGFTRREDKLQLSGYLHDLGICLHFQDDPVLKNTVILKPKWGTDAVYRVLDDHAILGRRGRFGNPDLERIWCDVEYVAMRDELLALMMRFQLCYALPGSAWYIAPQLLSPTRPAYDWDNDGGGLVLRYDYEFMPKGILTRFIVAANHLIESQELVWKSGVILNRASTRAEVIEDYPRRKITVRVKGADTRGLLAIVDDQLERIHANFARLKYDKLLPCNCEVCRARDEPFAYPLADLREFAAEGAAIQCRVSRSLVDAADLIFDVLPSASWKPPERFHRPLASDGPRAVQPQVKEVFVSYSWSDESTRFVDQLEEALAARGVALVRDKTYMRYKDSIRSFMERIGQGKCIVIVISKKYLESKSCMFELAEIAERGDLRGRVFPIVLDDAGIYEARGRLRYVRYWEQQRNELDAEMKEVGGEYLQGIREELDLYSRIRGMIGRITEVLGDMNALATHEHTQAGFAALMQALEARLAE